MRDISCAGIAVNNPTGAAFVAAPVIFWISALVQPVVT